MKRYKQPQIVFVYLDNADIVVCSYGIESAMSGYEDGGSFNQAAPSRKGPWEE